MVSRREDSYASELPPSARFSLFFVRSDCSRL